MNCLAIGVATFLFGKFVLYHINLVITNSSTIENLDKAFNTTINYYNQK